MRLGSCRRPRPRQSPQPRIRRAGAVLRLRYKEPVQVHGDVRSMSSMKRESRATPPRADPPVRFPRRGLEYLPASFQPGTTYQIFIPTPARAQKRRQVHTESPVHSEGAASAYSRMATIPLAGIEEPLRNASPRGFKTASAEDEPAGAEVRTADWDDLSSQRIVPKPIRPQTPGIPSRRLTITAVISSVCVRRQLFWPLRVTILRPVIRQYPNRGRRFHQLSEFPDRTEDSMIPHLEGTCIPSGLCGFTFAPPY